MSKATQVKHPWRASLRTTLQALIPTIAILVIVIPQAIEITIEETGKQGYTLPPSVYAFLLGLSGVIAVISGIITRISALPQVEELLEKFLPLLAAEPSTDEIEENHDDTHGDTQEEQ